MGHLARRMHIGTLEVHEESSQIELCLALDHHVDVPIFLVVTLVVRTLTVLFLYFCIVALRFGTHCTAINSIAARNYIAAMLF